MLRVETRRAWRAWLADNHAGETEIWLVFPKVTTGEACLTYEESVEEALCFGWIDSLVKRIDDDRYARKFTPRRPGSVWSERNKARCKKVISEGRMTDAGLRLVDEAQTSGEWDRKRARPSIPGDILPSELRAAFKEHLDAARNFHALPPTYRKQYTVWIATAKRPETRQRRTSEAIEKLERGERLGLR